MTHVVVVGAGQAGCALVARLRADGTFDREFGGDGWVVDPIQTDLGGSG